MFWAVSAARALATEVAESMENTSYFAPIPTTAAAYTPQPFITAVRYRKEMRTISSWKEMGIPTRASSLAMGRAIRKAGRLEIKQEGMAFQVSNPQEHTQPLGNHRGQGCP